MLRGEARGFLWLRLLNLHDELGRLEHCVCIRGNFRADIGIGFIGKAGAEASTLLDENFVAGIDEVANALRRQADTRFLLLDFSRHTNAHRQSPA